MSVEVETLIKNAVPGVAEGPFWEEETQSLLYVDAILGNVHRWHSKTKEKAMIAFGTYVTSFIIPHSKGGYIAGNDNKLVHFQWESHKEGVVLAELEEDLLNTGHVCFNDAKCDVRGRLFAGMMLLETDPKTLRRRSAKGKGNLFRFDVNGHMTRCRQNCTVSNGLAWSPDNKFMYYIDSGPCHVYAYDYDVTSGEISNERIILDMSTEEVSPSPSGYSPRPDGMTIDTDGNLWIAVFEGSRVIQLDPSCGKVLREIALPARQITSCCFGGDNYDELYVTSGTYGLTLEEDPLAGSIFRIKGLGCRGSPGVSYQGV